MAAFHQEATNRESARMARIYGEGMDARFAGTPIRANPYESDPLGGRQWQRGWDFMDREWGRDAKWKVRKLPEVREVA